MEFWEWNKCIDMSGLQAVCRSMEDLHTVTLSGNLVSVKRWPCVCGQCEVEDAFCLPAESFLEPETRLRWKTGFVPPEWWEFSCVLL